MRRLTRLAGASLWALVGAIVGAVVVLGVDGLTRPAGPVAKVPGPSGAALQTGPPERRYPRGDSRVLLAWSPEGLPVHSENALEGLRGVREATTVVAGLDWLSRSRAPDGTLIDAPRKGYSIPLEVAVIEPGEYARFVPAAERDLVLSLRPGEILLAETEARLRGYGAGLVMKLRDRSLRVSAVVSDVATNGYEGLLAGKAPSSWTRADRFALVRLARPPARHAVRARLLKLLGPGGLLRTRRREDTPFLRYGDAVQSQMVIKENFGEFAARPRPDGTIAIEPHWLRQNIRAQQMPVLGRVVCHRSLFPQLRQALREAVAKGFSYVVDTAEFGGCFSPRFINREPGGRLSHHAWGIAVDLNVSENAFGTKADQDARLVNTMERWGFTWGGRWIVPDGMHFEWNRWPS
ncbi:MAG TPA: M15 family metallopeptidase [Actinomycetota bacterium]|nr:M15 family metallopeptidase [Actinomycetota bacterium]